MYGAFEGDRLVGIIAFREGWVDQLYVLPDAQRRGVGRALLAVAMATYPDLSLWTFQRNQGARRFYERLGFVAVETTDGSSNEEGEPDAAVADAIGLRAYFCDPHSPWQRGSIENANGQLRRELPRKTSLDGYSDADLDDVIWNLNATPRKCLGYRTPIEAFAINLGVALEL